MKKSDIARKLKKRYKHMFLKDISQCVDIFFDSITEGLVEQKRIEMRGFGSFSTRVREARTARNPRTGNSVKVARRHSVYFRAGKNIRTKINK